MIDYCFISTLVLVRWPQVEMNFSRMARSAGVLAFLGVMVIQVRPESAVISVIGET